MRAFLIDAACWAVACAVGLVITGAFYRTAAFLSEAIELKLGEGRLGK